MVIVADNEDRENDGNLVMVASFVDRASIAFMNRYTISLLGVPMSVERLAELRIPLMVARNTDAVETAFAVASLQGRDCDWDLGG